MEHQAYSQNVEIKILSNEKAQKIENVFHTLFALFSSLLMEKWMGK